MIKPVSFKDGKEKDLIEYLNNNSYLDNFSYYVKELIKRDMKKSEYEGFKENESAKSIKRNANFDMF